ncbi:MAG: class I SAM-dependent DNA methyltransferase [Nostoc sp. DedVER02]|uniref:class I SAM-dependent DNA methyltransferase n=1 Tax=unclassified Nostoc TaxID=2593658 RepID=UPI002AD4B51A|nr:MULTISPECIES: class I SAM-dependent methyltransferase [unclassified Nostoc]MDZ7988320.1 class I SAM-dependent methyltransferase [Nostoc sp. DedVER02]MDZ8113616.1 class I SAM-dependent methyltransferase [Nostoc sp. DedVER01b]
MNKWYKEDLAFIHDDGFRDFALKSAPGILEILAQNKIDNGLVVDLGCGSGLWAQELTKAHYHVLGVDISESMINIARTRVPDAEFRIDSLFKTDIPPCNAVTSISECISYLFEPDSDRHLVQLFQRIYNALTPGGLFIFDIAEKGQIAPGTTTKSFTEGDGWVVLVEKSEDQEQKTLTRRIISFRKIGEHYRRSDEVHQVRLYEATAIASELCSIGFQVETTRSYGQYALPNSNVAFIARKPGS